MSLAMVLGFSSASGVRVCDARDCRRPPRHTVRVWWGPHRADPARVCGEHRRELELAGLVEDPMGCPVAQCKEAVGSGRRLCPSHTAEARELGHQVPQRGAISRDLLLELGRRQRAKGQAEPEAVDAPTAGEGLVMAALRERLRSLQLEVEHREGHIRAAAAREEQLRTSLQDRVAELQAIAQTLGLRSEASGRESLEQLEKVFERAGAHRDEAQELQARVNSLIEELQAYRSEVRRQVQQMEGAAELREQALTEALEKARTAEATVAYQAAGLNATKAAAQVEGYALAAQQLRHLLEFSPAAASELGRAAAEAVVAGHGDRDLCRRRLAQLPGLMAELGGPADGLYRPRAELVLQMVLPGLGDGEAPRPRVGEQAAALAGRVWRVDLHPSHWVGPVTALGGELLAVDDIKGARHVFSARNPHLRTSTISDQEWTGLQDAAANSAMRARMTDDEDIPW